jgi:hypothetical protein
MFGHRSAFFYPWSLIALSEQKSNLDGFFAMGQLWRLAMAQTARKKSSTDHQAKRTEDHEKIRRWAEERKAKPVMVEGTEILRFDFEEPDESGDEALRPVSWDEFFEVFANRDLEFLYQDHTQDGKLSRFNKFVSRSS